MSDWITEQAEAQKRLRAAFQDAATALCKPHKVLIRWQSPATLGESGSTSKARSGAFVVDISPNQPLDAQYRTFLHECGHVLGSGKTIMASDYHRFKPGSRGMVYKAADLERRRREDRANAIAEQLENYANANAEKYCNYRVPVIFARLKALAAGGPVHVVDHAKGVRP